MSNQILLKDIFLRKFNIINNSTILFIWNVIGISCILISNGMYINLI